MAIEATKPKGHVTLEQVDKISDAIADKIFTKVDKEDGKGLSANDFTDALKTKLEDLGNATEEDITKITTKIALDSSSYTGDETIITKYEVATSTKDGLMSAADKAKLDKIDEGATSYTHPDSGVVVGTYTSVTVDKQGHVTAGSNPTSLSIDISGNAKTADLAAKATTADTAAKAASADKATTAETATKAESADKATLADSATKATSADTATMAESADKLFTARTITLSGDATGSVAFDGSTDVTLEVTVTGGKASIDIATEDEVLEALTA